MSKTEAVVLIVFSAVGICIPYILPFPHVTIKHRYVVIAVHEHCEERWYPEQTWINIDYKSLEDGKILGAYLGGFNSNFKPVPVNLKARVSGEIRKDGNWTLQTIGFQVYGNNLPPFPYSRRIRIVTEKPSIYCAQIPQEENEILYFRDLTVNAVEDDTYVEEPTILYVILDEPMQFLIRIKEGTDIKKVYHLMERRSIKKSEFFIPEIDL